MSEGPEAWVDYDRLPMPRGYEKCSKCDGDRVLTHQCAPSMREVIAAGIRQYCSDCACEYGYHEPHRDLSLLRRVHDDAEAIADYIVSDGFNLPAVVGNQEEQG